MARDIYRQQSELIDQALNSEGEMDVCDLYQSSESEWAESIGDVKKRGMETRIEFSQDVNRLDSALNEMSLGKIQVLDEVDLDTVSTPVLDHTVDCRTKEDECNPDIYDTVCMKVNGSETLIVADGGNMCIKSFCLRMNLHRYSRLSMKCSPRRIVKLDDNKVAVSFDDSKQIALVSVFPNLTLDSTIATQKRYWGLTVLTPTTLAASSFVPLCVDILDMSFNVVRSFSPIHSGEEILQEPHFLCTTRQGNILISDCGTNSVACMTPQGEVVFNFSPTGDRALKSPAGITSTATGHILVVDHDGENVTVLKETGEFVRDLLTSQEGICYPWVIDLDAKGRIYVTHLEDDVDTLQVFTLK